MPAIGDRIKRCRQALGMSKAELALKAGLPRAPITRYEEGGAEPTIEALKKLMGALGVSADYLLGRADYNKLFKNPQLHKLVQDIKKMSNHDKRLICEIYQLLIAVRKIQFKK